MRYLSALAENYFEHTGVDGPRFVSHAAAHAARAGAGPFPVAAAPLPPELSFLANGIVAPALLQQAACLAKATGASPEATLLGEGWISEADYYRALATFCGVAFRTTSVRFVSTLRYPHSILSGAAEVVPLAGASWLMAPRGIAIARLIEVAKSCQGAAPGFEITTPTFLSNLIQQECRLQQLSDASFGVSRLDPALSAYRRNGNWQPFALVGAILLVTALCCLSTLVSAVIAVVFGVVFAAAIFVRLSALLASCNMGPLPAASMADVALPVYTVIVPLYDEAAVLPDLICALDRLDYPKGKLDIKLVVEACDTATRAAITQLALPARYETVVAPQGKPRTKPRALNLGLHMARGSLLVVYDAEDRPDPQQLRSAAASFAANPWLACLQAHLAIDNIGDSWLTRMFALEYAALFDVVDPGLCQLGLPLPLGGTSNHFKTSMLRDIYGWDAWNVTEDADLGLRLARLGYEVGSLRSTTLEEAPITLRAWLGQRSRWQKGWLQTVGTHLSQPTRFCRELGVLRAAMSAATVLGMALGALLGPVFTLALWRSVAGDRLLTPETGVEIFISTLATTLFIGGAATAVLPAWLGMRRRGLTRLWLWLALLPVYHLLGTFAAWRGLMELCSNPFHWQKTRHGVSQKRAAYAAPIAPSV